MAEVKTTPTPELTEPQGKEMERRPATWLDPMEGFGAFPYMHRFAEEMDRFLDDFAMPWPLRRRPGLLSRMFGRTPETRPEATWTPRIEMTEREGQLVIHAELPGMTRDNIHVEIGDEAVTLHGERKDERKEEKKGYYYDECRYGSFFRTIPLPEGVDPSKATAEFKNGVLEVMMPAPVPAEKKVRALEIKGD